MAIDEDLNDDLPGSQESIDAATAVFGVNIPNPNDKLLRNYAKALEKANNDREKKPYKIPKPIYQGYGEIVYSRKK